MRPFLAICAMGLLALCPLIAAAAADLQKQIDDAIAAGQAELIIPPGTYRLPAKPRQPQLLIRDAKNLTIIADDVTLVCTSLDTAIKVENTTGLTIQGLTIDYDPLPFTQGEVMAAADDHSWIDVRIDAGYPQPSADQNRRVILYDPQTRLIKPGTWTRHNVTVEPREDGTVRMDWGRPITDTLAVGDLITLTLRTNTPHGIYMEHTSDSTLRNVTLHASTSFGFFERNGGGNRYLACRAVTGPTPEGATAPRLLSTQADAFHSKHTDRGPQVIDCIFDSMGDDGIAINGDYALVVSAEGNTAVISPKRALPFQVGDRLHGIDLNGIPTADAKIVSITPIPTADAPDARAIQLKYYPDLRRPEQFWQQSYQIELDAPLPLAEGHLVASPDRNGSGFIARNNRIRNTRARGILVKASYGVIHSNTIEHTFLAAIVLCPETRFWFEADYSTDVAIVGNTIRRTKIGAPNAGAIQAGVITITAEGDGTAPSPAGGHRNILIDSNRIEDSGGTNLMITSADGVVVRNNTFVNPHQTENGHGANFGVVSSATIWISHANDVTLIHNTIENPGEHHTHDVLATDTVTELTQVDTVAPEQPQDQE